MAKSEQGESGKVETEWKSWGTWDPGFRRQVPRTHESSAYNIDSAIHDWAELLVLLPHTSSLPHQLSCSTSASSQPQARHTATWPWSNARQLVQVSAHLHKAALSTCLQSSAASGYPTPVRTASSPPRLAPPARAASASPPSPPVPRLLPSILSMDPAAGTAKKQVDA